MKHYIVCFVVVHILMSAYLNNYVRLHSALFISKFHFIITFRTVSSINPSRICNFWIFGKNSKWKLHSLTR